VAGVVVVRRRAVGACRDRSFVMASEVLPLATFSKYLLVGQHEREIAWSLVSPLPDGSKGQSQWGEETHRPSMMKVMRSAEVSK
jgi:hypothetical protein